MLDPIPGRSYTQLPAPQRLEKAHGALEALSTDAEIIATMDLVGYGPTDPNVVEGNALYTAAAAAFDAQEESYGDQFRETAELKAAYRAAYDEYQRLSAVARAAFRGRPDALKALGIGRFPNRQVDRLRRFRKLSVMARKPEYLPAFAAFEMDATAFDPLDALAEAFDTALHEAAFSRADAQHGTHTRDEALGALDGWMVSMHTVARPHFKDKPQLLEKLGIIVP